MLPAVSPLRCSRPVLRLLMGGLLLVSLLGLAQGISVRAASPATQASATNANTLVIAWWTPVDDLDPATSYSGTGALIMRGLYDTLVRMKGRSTTQLEGDLATSWYPSRHGKVWTFRLRHNVHFHDGSLF